MPMLNFTEICFSCVVETILTCSTPSGSSSFLALVASMLAPVDPTAARSNLPSSCAVSLAAVSQLPSRRIWISASA